ncbi:MAG: MFS transporter, partial [Anaerolineaceae bacterium]|nr:MFS transporter [Anaerolineaceae bacterium]
QLLGFFFSMRSVVAVIAGFIAPVMARKIGSKIKVSFLGFLLGTLSVLLMGFSNKLWLTVIGFQIRMFAISMAVPLFDAFSMESMPDENRSVITSIRETFWIFGFAVGPYLSGLVQKSIGFFPIFMASGVFFGASALLVWLFWIRTKPQLAEINSAV